MQVVANESIAFWDKDFDAWATCWRHIDHIRMTGFWERGGVTVINGWDELSGRIKSNMEANPEPNPTAADVYRKNVNVQITAEMAWVTFDQYGKDTGDLDMDIPGLSRETRVLEKVDSQWKIVYVNWLLEG